MGKWRLATSDGGLTLNREVWREQIERVKQGLDPIGVTRRPEDERLVRITSDDIYGLTWEEGMRLFDLTVEERLQMIEARGERPLALRPS